MSCLKRNKVLIIEDEPAICLICQRVLSVKGLDVDIVNNGKNAEEAVEKQEYDLLLVDLKLPVESGFEFYRWLQKKHPQLSNRVIFMTGSAIGEETMTFLERSGQPCLMKPFRPDELIEIVGKNLKQVKE